MRLKRLFVWTKIFLTGVWLFTLNTMLGHGVSQKLNHWKFCIVQRELGMAEDKKFIWTVDVDADADAKGVPLNPLGFWAI